MKRELVILLVILAGATILLGDQWWILWTMFGASACLMLLLVWILEL